MVGYYWFTNIDRIWRFWMVLPLFFFFLNTNAPYMSMKCSNISNKAQVATTVACTFRGRRRSYSSCSWSRTSPFLHRWLVSIKTARSRCATAPDVTRTTRTRVPSRARAKGGLKHVCAHTSIWAEAKGITRVVGTSKLCLKLGMDYERGTIAWAAVLPSSTSGEKQWLCNHLSKAPSCTRSCSGVDAECPSVSLPVTLSSNCCSLSGTPETIIKLGSKWSQSGSLPSSEERLNAKMSPSGSEMTDRGIDSVNSWPAVAVIPGKWPAMKGLKPPEPTFSKKPVLADRPDDECVPFKEIPSSVSWEGVPVKDICLVSNFSQLGKGEPSAKDAVKLTPVSVVTPSGTWNPNGLATSAAWSGTTPRVSGPKGLATGLASEVWGPWSPNHGGLLILWMLAESCTSMIFRNIYSVS